MRIIAILSAQHFTKIRHTHSVSDAITEKIRDSIRNELRRTRMKVVTLSQESGIAYTRLSHMLRLDKPTPIPAKDLDSIRRALGFPESWPISQLTAETLPGFASVHESTTAYGAPAVIPGSAQPDFIPREFADRNWQVMVMPDDSMMMSLAPGDILAVQPQTKLRFGFPHAVVIGGAPTVRMIDHTGTKVIVAPKNPSYPASDPSVPVIGVIVGRVFLDGNGDRMSRVNSFGIKL